MKFTKRYSHGLSMTASYSFQKEEVVGTETQNPAFQVAAPVINLDNLQAEQEHLGSVDPTAHRHCRELHNSQGQCVQAPVMGNEGLEFRGLSDLCIRIPDHGSHGE